MASTTIRISQQARDEARELARVTGKPISQVVEEAIVNGHLEVRVGQLKVRTR